MALDKNAKQLSPVLFPIFLLFVIILAAAKQNVILGCAAWKDRVNLEDTLFAGALFIRIGKHFTINCDSSQMAETMYEKAKKDLFAFMKKNEASHYHRLVKIWIGKRYSVIVLPDDVANVLPVYDDGNCCEISLQKVNKLSNKLVLE